MLASGFKQLSGLLPQASCCASLAVVAAVRNPRARKALQKLHGVTHNAFLTAAWHQQLPRSRSGGGEGISDWQTAAA
jgi:hypothetical protein